MQTPAKAVHILLVNYHYVAESSYCVKFYRNRLTHFGWANRGSFSFCFTYKHSNKQILSPRLQVTNIDRTERINALNGRHLEFRLLAIIWASIDIFAANLVPIWKISGLNIVHLDRNQI